MSNPFPAGKTPDEEVNDREYDVTNQFRRQIPAGARQ
jgi:hypothetical protein